MKTKRAFRLTLALSLVCSLAMQLGAVSVWAAPSGGGGGGSSGSSIVSGNTGAAAGYSAAAASYTLMASDESYNTFTFTEDAVTPAVATGSGYSISGTALKITAPGVYTVTGSCADGSITVGKAVEDVTLLLTDLTLASTETAPLTCNKNSSVLLGISGTVTLKDSEDPDNEDSSDATVADAFEGAAIKVKSGASLSIYGTGTLTADGSACKNGVKGGAGASIVFADPDLTAILKAANNGLACDDTLTIEGGNITIIADGDGIKASPDDGDTDSAGILEINGGTITVTAGDEGIQTDGGIIITDGSLDITSDTGDGVKSESDITIDNGTIKISARGTDTSGSADGIQTSGNLTINGGVFDITTMSGYTSSYNADSFSAKGLKASTSSDDETADTSDATNTITITGGSFTLNTADDAIHSDAYATITGGVFNIKTGDDGVHADTTLTLGAENGGEKDVVLTVTNSYEGLEAGTVNIYSGTYHVTASDDGINAAGGSSSGSDPGGGGGNTFHPGRPGGPGGPGGNSGGGSATASSYSLNIYGGRVTVNADGDGLDSNGALTLTGGNITVWGQSSGDNEPLDCDGTLTVEGATVFAAGCAGMGTVSSINSSTQSFISYGGTSGGFGRGGSSAGSISKGSTVNVKSSSNTVYNLSAVKAASYVFFSSPSITTSNKSNWSITSDSTDIISSDVMGHCWNSGTVSTAASCADNGVMTYTCSVCNATLDAPIPATGSHNYGSGAVTASADCTTAGVKTHVCSVCGDAKDVTVLPLGHDYDSDTGICTRCDASATAGEDGEDGFTVTFAEYENCEVTVYTTQTISDSYLDTGTTYYARNSDTGEIDTSGDGQINFTIVPASGYAVTVVTVSGSYKNIKWPSEIGTDNAYRITKISSDLTVTITATPEESESGELNAGTETVTWTYQDHTLTANGSLSETSLLAVSSYDSDGKMLSAGIISASGGTVSVSSDAAEVRLFWVNEDYSPKCAHVSFSG